MCTCLQMIPAAWTAFAIYLRCASSGSSRPLQVSLHLSPGDILWCRSWSYFWICKQYLHVGIFNRSGTSPYVSNMSSILLEFVHAVYDCCRCGESVCLDGALLSVLSLRRGSHVYQIFSVAEMSFSGKRWSGIGIIVVWVVVLLIIFSQWILDVLVRSLDEVLGHRLCGYVSYVISERKVRLDVHRPQLASYFLVRTFLYCVPGKLLENVLFQLSDCRVEVVDE